MPTVVVSMHFSALVFSEKKTIYVRTRTVLLRDVLQDVQLGTLPMPHVVINIHVCFSGNFGEYFSAFKPDQRVTVLMKMDIERSECRTLLSSRQLLLHQTFLNIPLIVMEWKFG